MLPAQLPEHAERENIGRHRLWKEWALQSTGACPLTSPALRGQPALLLPMLSSAGQHPPWASLAQRWPWILKSHPIFCSSLEKTKLLNKRRVVCLQRSKAGSSNNGSDWLVSLVSLCSSPGTISDGFLQTGHQTASAKGAKQPCLAGRELITNPSLYQAEFLCCNSYFSMGCLQTASRWLWGESEGNDTRDDKSITIIEPFIW